MKTETHSDKAIYRITIDAPIETVWAELIKTDAVLPFFFGSVCKVPQKMEAGVPMRMQTPNGKFAAVVGNITEFNPPHRYAHTFKFTSYEDAPCTVTYDLKEIPGGTEFTLTTTNVPVGTKTEKGMAQGGGFIVKTFKSVVETGRPSFGGRLMLGIMGLMAPFTPESCKIENWSFEKIEKL